MSPKLKLFVDGRKQTFNKLGQVDFSKEDWVWFHCASLGEYEQAVPLLEKFKLNYKILVSFFSPSGYEQKKSHKLIDLAVYLPIDTSKNAKQFVDLVKPKKALFVKYEFWENYFTKLQSKQIPIYMISSAFRENQIFFKSYGHFFKNTLKRVTHFFVQNKVSETILLKNGFDNVTISGDTRFDRVFAQLQMDNKLEFVEKFKGDRLCVVLGSTWSDCEEVFIDSINNSLENVCFIIAPHEIKVEKIKNLITKIKVKTSIYSKGIKNNSSVLVIDSIGFLTRIYNYADIAYVGGAVGTTGLHNILEPATFGVPIITGTNVEKFPEAKGLEKAGGLKMVTSSEEFTNTINNLIKTRNLRTQMGNASANFVKKQVGATDIMLSYLNL